MKTKNHPNHALLSILATATMLAASACNDPYLGIRPFLPERLSSSAPVEPSLACKPVQKLLSDGHTIPEDCGAPAPTPDPAE